MFRINSPHYLTKIVLPKGESTRRFSLVVSQFEKSSTIFFSVRAYSNQPFTLEKMKNPFRNKKEVIVFDMVDSTKFDLFFFLFLPPEGVSNLVGAFSLT